eukprot:jgi/Ulvmu1/4293/UM002_0013.1
MATRPSHQRALATHADLFHRHRHHGHLRPSAAQLAEPCHARRPPCFRGVVPDRPLPPALHHRPRLTKSLPPPTLLSSYLPPSILNSRLYRVRHPPPSPRLDAPSAAASADSATAAVSRASSGDLASDAHRAFKERVMPSTPSTAGSMPALLSAVSDTTDVLSSPAPSPAASLLQSDLPEDLFALQDEISRECRRAQRADGAASDLQSQSDQFLNLDLRVDDFWSRLRAGYAHDPAFAHPPSTYTFDPKLQV